MKRSFNCVQGLAGSERVLIGGGHMDIGRSSSNDTEFLKCGQCGFSVRSVHVVSQIKPFDRT